MSQRIFSPPSGPIKRGLYGLLSSIVKFPDLRKIRGEPIHFSNSAAVHPRRPICFEAFRKLHYCNSILFGLAIAALLCAPLSAWAVGQTKIVSVASDGTQGNSDSSSNSAISANGRYVAFASDADNLVPGDTNGTVDVFVRDRLSGQTSLISVGLNGMPANNSSQGGNIGISADGRYIVFNSFADNLVPGDSNGTTYDVFVRDRNTGQTSRVSVASDGTQGNDLSIAYAISADGRYVAFESYADNLVPGDNNGTYDVFVHDRNTGQTSRVSVASDGTQGNNDSATPTISSDGRYVVFQSLADNLVPGDSNGTYDIFIHDRITGQTDRVSVASDGTQGNNYSINFTAISADGRYVAFSSFADNLVPGDTNGTHDIFVRDRNTGQTSRVSVASDGTQGNIGSGYVTTISADGRYVAFESLDILVPEDTNGTFDIYVHDQSNGQTGRVNVATNGTQGNAGGQNPVISADGRYVVFNSYADNLVPGDTNGGSDIFIHDRLLLPNKKADLSVTQSESCDPVAKGNQFTYTVKIKNYGRDPASDVNLTDLVPLEAQLLSVTPSQGSCYKAPITVCRLGKLHPGASAQVQVKLKAIRSGVIRNTVSVNAAPKDLAPYNNSSTISTLIK